ncbi:MAG: hypothetical protein WCT14_12455 [Treponemataceae bacterium]
MDLLALAVSNARAEAEAALASRVDSVSLLGASDVSAWYRERTGGLECGAKVAAKLQDDIVRAERAALLARFELERDALRFFVNPAATVSTEAKKLSAFTDLDAAAAARVLASLESLSTALASCADLSSADYQTALETLAASDPIARSLLRGEVLFALSDGNDASALFLSDSRVAVERAESRQNAYQTLSSYASADDERRRTETWNAVKTALTRAGVALPQTGLPSIGAIGEALRADSLGIETAFAHLSSNIAAATSGALEGVHREIEEWQNALTGYVAARLLYDRSASPATVSDLESAQEVKTSQRDALQAILSSLPSASQNDARPLCAVLACTGGNIGALSRTLIEREAVERIARSLSAAYGAALGDDATLRAALTYDALSAHDYATAALRSTAVNRAFELVRARQALDAASDPDTLTGLARQSRLNVVFSSLDESQSAEAALTAFGASSRASRYLRAHILGNLAESVSAADFIAALTGPGSGGTPSWLAQVTETDGEEFGAAIDAAIEEAYAGGAGFSRSAAIARLDAYFNASLDQTAAYVETLRAEQGGASVVGERALALSIAYYGSDASYLAAVLSRLSLRTSPSALALFAEVSVPGFDLSQAAFLGLGASPYATEAAAYYTSLAVRSAFAALADDYAGSAVSGDPFQWAKTKKGLNDEDALELASFITTGRLSDAFDPTAIGSVLNQALYSAAGTLYVQSNESISILNSRSTLSRAYAVAAAAEQKAIQDGVGHWRTYLDPTLASGLDATSAGNAEGGAVANNVRAAQTWREGVLADAYEKAGRASALVEATFNAWATEDGENSGLDRFRAAALAYAANPSRAWTENDAPRVAAAVADAYSSSYRELQSAEYRALTDESEIVRVGAVLRDTSDLAAMETELKTIASRIAAARLACAGAMAAYSERASSFAAAGAAYDASYSSAKIAYQALEAARYAYEKEDAVRRWASTSYLSAQDVAAATYRGPEAELAYSRDRRDRAGIALRALETLYDGEAETRPYADIAYNILLNEYRESFSRMMLTVKARDALSAARVKETANNQKLYETYIKNTIAGSASFVSPLNYDGYTAVAEDKNAAWKDVLTVDPSGKLRIAYGNDYTLTKTDAAAAARLSEYFKTKNKSGIDTETSTAFELRARDWCARVANYGLGGDRFRVWALARDYLISQITEKNGAYEGLKSALVEEANDLRGAAGGAHIGGILNWETVNGRMDDFLEGDVYYYVSGTDTEGNETSTSVLDRIGLDSIRRNAWESLGSSEREDLEFYMILSLTGHGGETSVANSAFQRASELEQYRDTDEWFVREINDDAWCKDIWFLNSRYNELNNARNQYIAGYNTLKSSIGSAGYALLNKAATVSASYTAYRASCERLRALDGDTGGAEVDWLTIENSIRPTQKISEAEISRLRLYYQQFTGDGGRVGSSSSAALADIALWARNKRDDLKRDLEDSYQNDETDRSAAQAAYRTVFDQFVEGSAGQTELNAAVQNAYGNGSAAIKTHLNRLEEVAQNAAFSIIGSDGAFAQEYSQAASEFAALIERASTARYVAELSAREAEWDVLRADLSEKRAAWRTAADLILERGREDWKTAQETMNETHNAWLSRFKSQYTQSDALWNASWLASMKEKETWVARASKAADTAAEGAILALIGSDAEAAGRKMDGLGSYLITRADAEEADATLRHALGMAGITKMSDALSGSAASAGTSAVAVRTGLGGPSAWDSAKLQVAAADFARKTNEELAARQARLLAAQVRDAAQKAVTGLQENLDAANRGFKESMDETFVMDGKWQRAGSNYTKKVVVHSTLFDPMITENASVEGYIAYVMSPWTLRTDLSDGALANVDAMVIQALIEKAQGEVTKKSEEVFGTKAENDDKDTRKQLVYFYKTLKRQIGTRTEKGTDDYGVPYEVEVPVYEEYQVVDDEKTKEKTWGAGKFGSHVGFDPTLKENPNPDDGLDNIWQDGGKGELGRLLRSYIYWSLKENRGFSELNKPTYEKRFWDDRGQWFKAPTIRGTVDIGMQVVTTAVGVIGTPFTGGASLAAAVAINTAINMADDAVFTALDIAGGYKNWEEAGLEFGKKALTSAATSAISFGFGGLGSGLQGVAGVNGVIGRTMLSGMQSFTTSTVSSAISAIQWNGNGLSWSGDAFSEGVRGGLIGAATGMTSSLTSGMLGQMNLFDGNRLGLVESVFDKKSIESFNGMMGSLAGQGVNFALTGDFALNVAKGWGSGLLELHMGKNGISMNLGTGGADVSLGTIASSMSGMMDTLKIGGAKLAAMAGSYEGISTLNAVNMMGYSGNGLNTAIGRGLWGGQLRARYGNTLDEYGHYNGTLAPNEIALSAELLGPGKEKAAKLAAVLAHEGTHVAGNRVEGFAHVQGYQTYETLNSIFGMSGDSDFTQGMEYALSQAESWQENTGDTDYWKVMKNGDIMDDGRDGEIGFEDGRQTVYTKNKTKQGSLEEYLGVNPRSLNKTLDDAGFVYGGKGKGWIAAGKTISAGSIQSLIAAGTISNEIAKTLYSNTQSVYYSGGIGLLRAGLEQSIPYAGEFELAGYEAFSGEKEYPVVDGSKRMQDFDPDNVISLGGSKYTVHDQGCRITATGRIVTASGTYIDPLVIATDKTNFINSNGDLNDTVFFQKYNLSLEGPITNIEERLKTFVADGNQGWLYATVPFGEGTHTINLKNVKIDAAGKISFDKQGTSKSDWDRNFGVYSNSNKPNYYQLSQLYIVTRKK